MEQNSQPINAQPINVQQPKKSDTKVLIIIVAVILGLFFLLIFGIYFVTNFLFSRVIEAVGVPPDEVFVEYLSDKYDGDTFTNTGKTGGSGCSYFELGFCDKIYHSEKYNRDFKVVYHRGDSGYFTDEYWLAQHGDNLDAHYKQLFSGIFDYDYTLKYTSNSSELNNSAVDLSTEELLKDSRFWITVEIIVAEKDVEGTALDIRALQSAMTELRGDISGAKEVIYTVKSDDGRYPDVCSAVNPGVKSSSSDYCSEVLIFNYIE